MKNIIHVAQDAIRKNMKEGSYDPPLIIRNYKGATRHHTLDLVLTDGTVIGSFHYSPDKPLSCGARVWLTLDSNLCTPIPKETNDANSGTIPEYCSSTRS